MPILTGCLYEARVINYTNTSVHWQFSSATFGCPSKRVVLYEGGGGFTLTKKIYLFVLGKTKEKRHSFIRIVTFRIV